jgi:hypothetical protein
LFTKRGSELLKLIPQCGACFSFATWATAQRAQRPSGSTRQRTLERFLAIFLSGPKQPPAEEIFHPWTAVDWRGTEATGQEIAELLDEQDASIRSVVQEMQRRGSVEAASRRIPVTVIVRDCRRDARESMPRVEPFREVAIP